MVKWDSFQGCKDFSVSTKSINVIHHITKLKDLKVFGTSMVVQWIGISPPMQET